MPNSPVPRRRFLAGLATGVGGAWLAARPSVLQATALDALRIAPDEPFKVLTIAEAGTLDAMAERIIPADETPGAHDARVVRYMDLALASFAADLLPLIREAVAQLETTARERHPGVAGFAALPAAAQDELLRELEAAESPFFEVVRVGTISGMFANPEYGGNHDKIGWRLIGFEDRFYWEPPFGDYDRE